MPLVERARALPAWSPRSTLGAENEIYRALFAYGSCGGLARNNDQRVCSRCLSHFLVLSGTLKRSRKSNFGGSDGFAAGGTSTKGSSGSMFAVALESTDLGLGNGISVVSLERGAPGGVAFLNICSFSTALFSRSARALR